MVFCPLDPQSFADPDSRSQNLANPTDPDLDPIHRVDSPFKHFYPRITFRSAKVLGENTGFVGFGTAAEAGFVPLLQPDDGVPPDFRLNISTGCKFLFKNQRKIVEGGVRGEVRGNSVLGK